MESMTYTLDAGRMDVVKLALREVDGEVLEMSRFPVTNELFEALMGFVPSRLRMSAAEVLAHAGSTGGGQMRDYPVTNVSFWEAVAFCNALSACMGLNPAYRVEHGGTARVMHEDPESGGWALPSVVVWKATVGRVDLFERDVALYEWTCSYHNNSYNPVLRRSIWHEDYLWRTVEHAAGPEVERKYRLESPPHRRDHNVGFRVVRLLAQ